MKSKRKTEDKSRGVLVPHVESSDGATMARLMAGGHAQAVDDPRVVAQERIELKAKFGDQDS